MGVFSKAGVPANTTGSVLDFLLRRFPQVSAEVWLHRLHEGMVQDNAGRALCGDDPVAGQSHIFYQRSIANEAPIPFEFQVLFQNAHLLVVDKPHFLPVMPAGQYVQETVLYRLQQQFKTLPLVPLHRIDRDTAGLVMFSTDSRSRNAYHALFREHLVRKIYEAIAPMDVQFLVPHEHHSHMAENPENFFRMHEVAAAEPNSHTHMKISASQRPWARYQLEPISGKHHQLRVHMAALGVPILNDPYYPTLKERALGHFSAPLQLLAKSLRFTDPISNELMEFHSRQSLQFPTPATQNIQNDQN